MWLYRYIIYSNIINKMRIQVSSKNVYRAAKQLADGTDAVTTRIVDEKGWDFWKYGSFPWNTVNICLAMYSPASKHSFILCYFKI